MISNLYLYKTNLKQKNFSVNLHSYEDKTAMSDLDVIRNINVWTSDKERFQTNANQSS